MMFKLIVVGQEEAEQLFYKQWPTRIVSLTGAETLYYGPHHLHVRVDDVAFVGQHTRSPSKHHLQEVFAFTADLTANDRLLVHCHVGQSRSTAVAIGIMMQHGLPYDAAFDHVESVRSVLMPNPLFIRLIDEHFQEDGRLIEYAAKHRSSSLAQLRFKPADAPSKTDIEKMKNMMRMLQNV